MDAILALRGCRSCRWHQAGQKGEVGTWMACIQPASQLARCSHTRSEWTVYAGVFIPLCNAVVIFSDTLPASSPSRGKNTLARSLALRSVCTYITHFSPLRYFEGSKQPLRQSRCCCCCKPLEKRKPLIFMTKSIRLAMHARIDRLWAFSDAWESAAGKCDALLLLFRQHHAKCTLDDSPLAIRSFSLLVQPVHFGARNSKSAATLLLYVPWPGQIECCCHPVWRTLHNFGLTLTCNGVSPAFIRFTVLFCDKLVPVSTWTIKIIGMKNIVLKYVKVKHVFNF